MSKFITHFAKSVPSWITELFSRNTSTKSAIAKGASPSLDPSGLLPSPARMEISLGLRRNSDRRDRGWDFVFRQMSQAYIGSLNEISNRYFDAHSSADVISAAEYMQRKIAEMPISDARVAMRMMLCNNKFGGESRGQAMHLACARGILQDIPKMSGSMAIANAALFVAEVAAAYDERKLFENAATVYQAVRPDFDVVLAARKHQKPVCNA